MPHSSHLRIETTRGDHILLDIPRPDDLTPIGGRSTIYLDQNHWSTLAKAIHEPRRIINEDERDAALRLIDLGISRRIILPMSSGHMAETCKWTDNDRRYHLALTFAQLGAGWQLRDPLDVRRFELRQAFITTYQNYRLLPPPTIMLEPDAMHGHIPRRAAARTDL